MKPLPLAPLMAAFIAAQGWVVFAGETQGADVPAPRYGLRQLNVPPCGKEKYSMEVTWEISPQPFKAGELRFAGTVRIVNRGAAPLPVYLRGIALGVRLTDPAGHLTIPPTDLPDPEAPASAPPAKSRTFQILEATRNGSPVKTENTEPIILAPGDCFAVRVALNWASVKVDPGSAFTSLEVLRQYHYGLTLPLVVGDGNIQIRHTESIGLSAHIQRGE
jgi:hypothetical protein